MSNKKLSKNIFNDIGNHCQLLVDDFFHFCEGEVDQITIITELRDIKEPMPPKVEQLRTMLARCDKAWKDYCRFMLLPGESQKMFINRVKKKWQALEKQQQLPIRKRKGESEGEHHQ